MSTERDKAIDKIRKLLRLSKSSNEHEAAAAMRQAGKLMKQYNLDTDDVSDDIKCEWKTQYEGNKLSGDLEYIVTCVNLVFCTVASLNHYKTTGKWASWKQSIVFYGRGASAKLAVYGAECMVRQMNKDRALFVATTYPFATTHQKREAAKGFNRVWLHHAWENLKDIVPDQEAVDAARARREKSSSGRQVQRRNEAVHVSRDAAAAASAMGAAFRLAVPVGEDSAAPKAIGHG